ncbi:MAG: type II toxin-antitoxin system RelE/ParE family toxin [Spirochaetales bacterium]|nr:type II toxin-antitoxin system RelE/ParE family toxin [Spirochaetales bacterium]
MGNKYTLFFTRHALDDMRDIYRYIFEELDNPRSAIDLIDSMEKRIESLEVHPFSGSKVLDHDLLERGYRKLVIGNYIALYKVDESSQKVNIVRVIYGKRNYSELI